jgi:hypothetical protein
MAATVSNRNIFLPYNAAGVLNPKGADGRRVFNNRPRTCAVMLFIDGNTDSKDVR